MSYKYSNDYDEIIDLDADVEFIKNFHSLEKKIGYNELKNQLRKIYELERIAHKHSIIEDIGQVWYEEGLHLSYLLESRAYKLIERVSAEYLKETRLNSFEEEEFLNFIESYDAEIINMTISILKSCLFIFDNRGTDIVLGKKRDVERYREIYSELTSSELEIQKQAKQKILK